MRKQRIVWLLLLAAFIAPLGFNEPAFAAGFVPPAWSQKLPAKQRFQLVLDGQAVLDKETGLVWERSPSTTQMNWFDAIFHCYNKNVGGRKGWRLPTVEELTSLIDQTRINPALPLGHPFNPAAVRFDWYWSATSNVDNANACCPYVVNFDAGAVSSRNKPDDSYVWCVRGGHGHDGQLW